MDEFLKTKYRRKIFYLISFLLLLVIYLIRFYFLPFYFNSPVPSVKDILNSILDDIMATIFVTVSIASLIFWLTPPVMQQAKMEVIEPIRIKDELKEARNNTKIYWYKGGCGRFTRAVTIPELAAEARASNQHKQIYIQILDVTNKEICQNYSEYRRSLRSANLDQPWSPERVQLELYSTIVAAYCWKTQVPLLEIQVALTNSISLFRLDLSSKTIVITKEDKQEPGLKCDEGTFFYNSYLEELRLSLKQARLLPSKIKGYTIDELNQTNVQKLLTDLGIFNNSLTDDQITIIINLTRKSKNPYA